VSAALLLADFVRCILLFLCLLLTGSGALTACTACVSCCCCLAGSQPLCRCVRQPCTALLSQLNTADTAQTDTCSRQLQLTGWQQVARLLEEQQLSICSC
jgi:hypothetical protein